MMTLVFTRSGGRNPAKYDRLDIRRADGSAETIDCPKQGIIPHDMVHFAVEAVLAARGFLHVVAAGGTADFAGGSYDAEAGAVERLVETVQAEAWSGGSDDAAFLALYRLTCDARDVAPLAIDAAAVAAIRARVAELTAAWAAVPERGRLTLTL